MKKRLFFKLLKVDDSAGRGADVGTTDTSESVFYSSLAKRYSHINTYSPIVMRCFLDTVF